MARPESGLAMRVGPLLHELLPAALARSWPPPVDVDAEDADNKEFRSFVPRSMSAFAAAPAISGWLAALPFTQSWKIVEMDGMVCDNVVMVVDAVIDDDDGTTVAFVDSDANSSWPGGTATDGDEVRNDERFPAKLSSSSAKSSSDWARGSESTSDSFGGPSSSYTLSSERYGSGPGDEHTNSGGERAIG